ncbi:MAG TPA: hypothetical protein VIU87_26245, partial [Mycobacterium sp.]
PPVQLDDHATAADQIMRPHSTGETAECLPTPRNLIEPMPSSWTPMSPSQSEAISLSVILE